MMDNHRTVVARAAGKVCCRRGAVASLHNFGTTNVKTQIEQIYKVMYAHTKLQCLTS